MLSGCEAGAERPRIFGRCPGAWRPMHSGDGLIVRLRARLGRLTRAQALGVCAAATRLGAGVLDLTNRAHLQIRGVPETAWAALLEELIPLGLLDDSAQQEARHNILIAPDWRPGDESERIARELLERLHELPALPAKVGFAIDAGAAPCLLDVAADFRIERGAHGGLILRAQGHPTGVPIAAERAVDGLLALAQWFVDSGGAAAGRMARHRAPLPAWARGEVPPAPGHVPFGSTVHPLGVVCALPFGQIGAARLAQALRDSAAVALRLTPWRRVLFEGTTVGTWHESLVDADFEALAARGWRIEACAGAPHCAQASVATRPLAQRIMALAARERLRLPPQPPVRVIHVSGCAKRCAHPQTAAIHVIGRGGAYDLGWLDEPLRHQGLSAEQVIAHLELF